LRVRLRGGGPAPPRSRRPPGGRGPHGRGLHRRRHPLGGHAAAGRRGLTHPTWSNGHPATRPERSHALSTDDFDEKAATWDADPAKVERARVVAEAVRATVPLDRSTRLLEYGAGTGLVTQALRDAVGPVTLADTSAGMRDVMQAKVA